MICFNCGYMLSDTENKECGLCGAKFHQICEMCGAPNPLMANFCLNCGTKLARQDITGSVRNFQILSENRKNIAVIFADISGFTALSEKMDPEEVREIINACYDYITKPIYEMEGTIDKYIGDCIMVLFGAKYSHTDDAMRAVTCAMKMMDLIRSFSEELFRTKGVNLSMSIGINYGLVITGSIGNNFDKDYTVIGDTVNTAQRLQSNAPKGKILVSQSVYDETKEIIEYSEMHEIVVKNKENPVVCYVPKELKKTNVSSDFDVIDRDNEINLLSSIVKNNEKSKAIAVIGEPGIGKTSLIKKFTLLIENDIKAVWVKCDSIYQKKVYHLVNNIICDIADISFDTGTNKKKTRLMSYIEFLLQGFSKDEIQRNFDFLGLIMGFDRSKDFQDILNSMKYDDIKREIINQFSIFMSALCKDKKVICVIDDVQNADLESVRILSEMLNRLADKDITLIFNTSFEIELFDKFGSNKLYTIKLERLTIEGVNKQLCRLLNCKKIDEGLLYTVYKYTNGNPLYVRELVNSIKRDEKCAIEGETAYLRNKEIITLPNSIESVILSNLSWLDEGTDQLLRAASVIGYEFNLSWAKSILDFEIEENESIKLLTQLNIISLKSVKTSSGIVDRIYTFQEDIVREAIYDSILNKSKKNFHKKLGEMLEIRYSGELDKYYELLCMHYEAAGLSKKAGDYCLKAAMKLKNDFNYSSAIEYYDKFLQLINTNSEMTNAFSLLNAYIDIGFIYSSMSEYDKALDYLNKALSCAELSDDIYSIKIMIAKIYKDKAMYDDATEIIKSIEPKIRQNTSMYGKILQLKCTILRMQGNPDALGVAEKSEEILLKNRNYESLSETMSQAGILYFIRGDMENAIYYFNRAYDYAERVNNLRVMGMAANNLGIAYHASGMISKAQEYFNKSIELSKKTSHVQNYIANNINLGILFLEKGLFRKAQYLFIEALEKAEQVDSLHKLCVAQLNLGDMMYEIGDFDKAQNYYSKSINIAEKCNIPVEKAIGNLGIARIHMKSGSYKEIPSILDDAYQVFKEAEEVAYVSDCYRYRSIYELQKNNLEEAEKLCEIAISIAIEVNNDMKKLKALRLKGIILTLKEEYIGALECYDEAVKAAELLESDYETAKCFFRRYITLHNQGRMHDAAKDLDIAKEAIDRIDMCRWTNIIHKEFVGK